MLREKPNTWTWYLKKFKHHISKIKVYMCAHVTPNEIFLYLFCLSRHDFSNNQFFSDSPLFLSKDQWNTWPWHFKKVEHHTSKIKVYMCARVTPNEIFSSLFICRAMLSPTTNFAPTLHCSYKKNSERHEHGISKELLYINLKSKCAWVRACNCNQTFPLLMHQHKQ